MSKEEIDMLENAHNAVLDENRLRKPPPGGRGMAAVVTRAMNNAITEYNKKKISQTDFDNALMILAQDQQANPNDYPNYPSNPDYDLYFYRRGGAYGIKYRRTRKPRKRRKHRRAKKSRKTQM